jgi:hypothetical protein
VFTATPSRVDAAATRISESTYQQFGVSGSLPASRDLFGSAAPGKAPNPIGNYAQDPGFAPVDPVAPTAQREISYAEEVRADIEAFLTKAETELTVETDTRQQDMWRAIGAAGLLLGVVGGSTLLELMVGGPVFVLLGGVVKYVMLSLIVTVSWCLIVHDAAQQSAKSFVLCYFVPFFILYYGARNLSRVAVPYGMLVGATLVSVILLVFILVVELMR